MTMLADTARHRHVRRAHAVYRTLPARHAAPGAGRASAGTASLRAELAALAMILLVAAGLIALRAWLHLPQL